MSQIFKNLILCSLFAFLFFSFETTIHAEEETKIYAFQLIDEISEENFNKLNDSEKISLLLRTLRQKDQLLKSLTNNLKQNNKLETVQDILDEATIKIVQETIEKKVSKLIKVKEAELVQKNELKEINPVSTEVAATVDEKIEAEVSEFVFDKKNISDINTIYKITHEEKYIELLEEALSFENNIELIARRFHIDNLDKSYEEIAENYGAYQLNKDILDYLSCINLSDKLCSDSPGKNSLLENIDLFLNPEKRVQIETQTLSENFSKEIPENFTEKVTRVTVTSYNPACEQTKGGIMSSDGNCYATPSVPCAIGKNKGKTAGLCGTPTIGGSGHNLSDLKESGEKPIAVSPDLSFLRGKKVFLRCFNKKGEELFDSRCSGFFLVYDSTHGRIKNTIDVYIDEKREDGKYNNIGGVTVEIYYAK